MGYMLPRPVRVGLKQALASRWFYFFSKYYAGCLTCLNYHRVTLQRAKPGFYQGVIDLAVHQDAFSEQIRILKTEYNCLPLSMAVELLKKNELPERAVVVTFDDGYRDNLTLAVPVLEAYQVPASIFLTIGLVDGTVSPWWYELDGILLGLQSLFFQWQGSSYDFPLVTFKERRAASERLSEIFKGLRPELQSQLLETIRLQCPGGAEERPAMLSWEEVGMLDRNPLITIGGHTMTHPVLSSLTNEELEREVGGCKQVLEQRLGHPLAHFAYPYGSRRQVGEREIKMAETVGFSSALVTRNSHWQPQHVQHLFSLPRIIIDHYDDAVSFRWKLSGLEAMLCHQGRRFVVN